MEILVVILCFEDLCRLRRVCKSLKAMVESMDFLRCWEIEHIDKCVSVYCGAGGKIFQCPRIPSCLQRARCLRKSLARGRCSLTRT